MNEEKEWRGWRTQDQVCSDTTRYLEEYCIIVCFMIHRRFLEIFYFLTLSFKKYCNCMYFEIYRRFYRNCCFMTSNFKKHCSGGIYLEIYRKLDRLILKLTISKFLNTMTKIYNGDGTINESKMNDFGLGWKNCKMGKVKRCSAPP